MKRASGGMRDGDNLLLTDYYQLAMFQVYVERRLTDTACFELFVRKLPPAGTSWLPPGLSKRPSRAFVFTTRRIRNSLARSPSGRSSL